LEVLLFFIACNVKKKRLEEKVVTLQKFQFNMKGQNRSDVKIGKEVGIVLKENQVSGVITKGTVQDILTNSLYHPHGIKVRLTTGEVGRVKIVK
jgi:uncharacterized repeat protein (TIGR03833 family)